MTYDVRHVRVELREDREHGLQAHVHLHLVVQQIAEALLVHNQRGDGFQQHEERAGGEPGRGDEVHPKVSQSRRRGLHAPVQGGLELVVDGRGAPVVAPQMVVHPDGQHLGVGQAGETSLQRRGIETLLGLRSSSRSSRRRRSSSSRLGRRRSLRRRVVCGRSCRSRSGRRSGGGSRVCSYCGCGR